MKPFIIGITGVVGAGKDTLFWIIQQIFPEHKFKQITLANQLKKELEPFLISQFGISPFTQDREKKDLIRPIMVEYARVKRIISKGTYFTKIAQQEINNAILDDYIPVVTDIRYAIYEQDEYSLIKNNNGFLIHLSRTNTDGRLIKAPNKDEKTNDPILKKLADIKIKLKTQPLDTIIQNNPHIKELINNEFSKKL